MSKYLIIGGRSGIGKAVVSNLGSKQNDLYIPSHKEVDVSYRGVVRDYIKKKGPFKYIVYSAGYNRLSWIKDLGSPHDGVIDDTFDINVLGFINLAANHVELFPEAVVSVVAVSSDAADIPMRGSLAYCASKAALNMAIRVMARELAPLWRVNGVAPGMVEGTAMTKYIDETIPEFRGWTSEKARNYERASVPTGRRATLREVAETISWVLHGPMQMTGEIVKINGGR